MIPIDIMMASSIAEEPAISQLHRIQAASWLARQLGRHSGPERLIHIANRQARCMEVDALHPLAACSQMGPEEDQVDDGDQLGMVAQEAGLPKGVSVEKFGLEGLRRAQRHTSLSPLRAFPESV